jgi:UDP-N-acetylglucosamine transferase subunit ALG13
MIFATVGTQLAFPRLMRILDDIAGRRGLEVFAQTCEPDLALQHLKGKASLHPGEFAEAFQNARVIVAHAGIGTILSAKQYGKPLILFPRRASLGEHRNEHQLATVEQMRGRTGLYVAEDAGALEALLVRDDLSPADNAPSPGRAPLVAFLRDYINQ